MPFSHHSHSGEFCLHAKNTLEEMVLAAISKKMKVYALTEHMPRSDARDLYPEEIKAAQTPSTLQSTFNVFHAEAVRLKTTYASQISLLVGAETEWIRASCAADITQLLATHALDTLVGSVHHVHGIPIDYDDALYARAQAASGGSDERLFEAYFDAQLAMLQALRPPVVGHFDLVRLKSAAPDRSLYDLPGVWERVERNLELVRGYGGVLEVSSAALRKGLRDPYPGEEVCRLWLYMGGRVVMSDDAHEVGQVGAEYPRLVEYLEECGFKEVWCLRTGMVGADERFPGTGLVRVGLEEVKDGLKDMGSEDVGKG